MEKIKQKYVAYTDRECPDVKCGEVLIMKENLRQYLVTAIDRNADNDDRLFVKVDDSWINNTALFHVYAHQDGTPIGKLARNELEYSSIDALFLPASRVIMAHDIITPSYFQRTFNINYNRASRLLELLEFAGVVGEYKKPIGCPVLVKNEEDLQKICSGKSTENDNNNNVEDKSAKNNLPY